MYLFLQDLDLSIVSVSDVSKLTRGHHFIHTLELP